jgi:hypothetical protein
MNGGIPKPSTAISISLKNQEGSKQSYIASEHNIADLECVVMVS